MEKTYETPTIVELGSVEDFTRGPGGGWLDALFGAPGTGWIPPYGGGGGGVS